MFGKFHLAGPDNNQAGNGTPLQLGWDYFYGWIRGGPAGLDTTAGGVAPTGTYSCGFVPSAVAGGADRGACYQPDNSCKVITGVNADGDVAGKQCMQSGGILVPNATYAGWRSTDRQYGFSQPWLPNHYRNSVSD
jgi:hypothetical protein